MTGTASALRDAAVAACDDPLDGHPGWRRTFPPGRLTLGLALPVEPTRGGPPAPERLAPAAAAAERLGFAAVWVRDLTLLEGPEPEHGQLLDPWVALGAVCAATSEIAIGVASIVLPIRHPLHVATSALSLAALSGDRFLLGLGTGARPSEFEALGLDHEDRGRLFREAFAYLEAIARPGEATAGERPARLPAREALVLHDAAPVPLLLTGWCSQPPELAARMGDGHLWAAEPRLAREFAELAAEARPGRRTPYASLLRIDLVRRRGSAPATPVYRRLEAAELRELAGELQEAGAGHLVLDLRWCTRPLEQVLDELASEVLPAHRAG